MALSTKTYTVEPVDLSTADDELLREVTALTNTMEQERVPEEPPMSFEAFASRVRNRPAMVMIRDWLARSADGGLVGRGYVIRFEADTNQHLRDAGIDVLPTHRRKGIAKQLLRELVAGAGPADDIVLSFFTNDRVPAAGAFLQRIGAKRALTMRASQLDLSPLDRAMVRDWAGIETRGYRLEWIDGDVPEKLMKNVIVAYDTMNTAPRGDSAMQEWNTTPGETAGYTELAYDPKIPHLIWQQGTAVIPSHRGHGLGKWIKAAMLERALRDWPKAQLIRTGNADANAPMLAINNRPGFKPAWAESIWEVGIADARR